MDMNIKTAYENGKTAFYENRAFSKCIYAPDSLLEYAFIKGYQHVKSTMLAESCQDEVYEDDNEFFLNYGWIPYKIAEVNKKCIKLIYQILIL